MKEAAAFHAALGALVPSFMLFFILGRNMRRVLPAECNRVLDANVWLAPEAIYPHLQCLGSLGRTMYLEFYAFDLFLFPAIYSVALYGALRRAFPSHGLLRLLPFVAAAADIVENCCMCFLLTQFPSRYEGVEMLISPLTRTKCTLVIGSAVVAVAGSLVNAIGAKPSSPQREARRKKAQ